MSQTRPNKIVTITNDEIYDLATHDARQADSTNVIVNVTGTTERDAIPKYTGLTVRRLDVVGHPLEEWNGTAWDRSPVWSTGNLVTDGFWSITGKLVKNTLSDVSMVTLMANLVRTGPAITVNVGDSALLLGMVPSGFRPPANHYWNGTVNTALAGSRYAEPQFIIGDSGNGNWIARSISGGPITISTGYAAFLQTSWYL